MSLLKKKENPSGPEESCFARTDTLRQQLWRVVAQKCGLEVGAGGLPILLPQQTLKPRGVLPYQRPLLYTPEENIPIKIIGPLVGSLSPRSPSPAFNPCVRPGIDPRDVEANE